MSFTEVTFLIFVAFAALVYYIVPKKCQWAVLLAASYVFYLSYGLAAGAFIVFTTLLTFFFSKKMDKISGECTAYITENKKVLPKDELKEKKKEYTAKKRKWLIALLVINLGILCAVKYIPTIVNKTAIRGLLYPDDADRIFKLIVPLGISFYTFMSISYAVDIYRNKYAAETHLGRFALYISFFPQIIQGPISRFDEVGVQYAKPHKFDFDNLVNGLELMLWGYFKKLVVADRAYPFVVDVYSNSEEYSGLMILMGVLMYALQIYCDFSGCIDITRGVAKIFDIELPLNFERPYFSRNVSDFWRRWHITLGAFMRDYVFYSVMFSRPYSKFSKWARGKFGNTYGKIIPNFMTTYAVFICIGLWHGASWNFIAFGLYNATGVVLGMLMQPTFDKWTTKLKINKESPNWQMWDIVRTFSVLLGSKLLARSGSLTAGLHMIKALFDWSETKTILTSLTFINDSICTRRDWLILMASVIIILTISILQERGIKIREGLQKLPVVARWALLLGLVVFVVVFGVYNSAQGVIDPIYQQY